MCGELHHWDRQSHSFVLDTGSVTLQPQISRKGAWCRTHQSAPLSGLLVIGRRFRAVTLMKGRYPVFVTVIHHIHDPEGFQAAEAKALEGGLPSHVALPIHAATNDHELGICIWEGESVDAVREVVEGAVGPWANNEYYEMHVDGLTPQLSK